MAQKSYTIPAPNGGLNVLDSLDTTPETDARELTNVWPGFGDVEVLPGYSTYCTPVAGNDAMMSLASFADNAGNEYMIGTSVNGTVLDLSTNSPVNITTGYAGSGLSQGGAVTDTIQATCFLGKLFCCDNVNQKVYLAQGGAPCTWSDSGIKDDTGAAFTPCSTGVYKQRLYIVKANTTKIYYLAPNAITYAAGTVFVFDVGGYLTLGGYVVQCGSLSSNSNEANDLFYVLSTRGEVLIFSGLWPGRSDWTLMQRYFVGTPQGFNSVFAIGARTYVLTQLGLVPLSENAGGDYLSDKYAINSNKIDPVLRTAAWGTWNQGGLVTSLPAVAILSGGAVYLMNPITKAWCRYCDFETLVNIAVYKGNLYATNENNVLLLLDPAATNQMIWAYSTTFTALNSPETKKNLKQLKLRINSSDNFNLTVGIQKDKDVFNTMASFTIPIVAGANNPSIGGLGDVEFVSLRLSGATIRGSTINIYSTSVLYEPGTWI